MDEQDFAQLKEYADVMFGGKTQREGDMLIDVDEIIIVRELPTDHPGYEQGFSTHSPEDDGSDEKFNGGDTVRVTVDGTGLVNAAGIVVDMSADETEYRVMLDDGYKSWFKREELTRDQGEPVPFTICWFGAIAEIEIDADADDDAGGAS